MRRGDLIWLLCFVAAGLSLSLPGSRDIICDFSLNHRYLVGFLSFSAMGFLGEALVACFRQGYSLKSLVGLACMWGIYGLALALLMWLINGGVVMLQAVGMLPWGTLSFSANPIKGVLSNVQFTQPLFSSIFLNLLIIHPMLTFRRLFLEKIATANQGKKVELSVACGQIDWFAFINRELSAAIMFKIPLMTIVFMQPQGLWLAIAAFATAVMMGMEELILRSRASKAEKTLAESSDQETT